MRRLSPCKTAAKCSRDHQSPTDGDRERRRRPHAQGPAGRSSGLCASPTSVLCLAVPHYFIVLYCPFILSSRFLYFVCSDVLTKSDPVSWDTELARMTVTKEAGHG